MSKIKMASVLCLRAMNENGILDVSQKVTHALRPDNVQMVNLYQNLNLFFLLVLYGVISKCRSATCHSWTHVLACLLRNVRYSIYILRYIPETLSETINSYCLEFLLHASVVLQLNSFLIVIISEFVVPGFVFEAVRSKMQHSLLHQQLNFVNSDRIMNIHLVLYSSIKCLL